MNVALMARNGLVMRFIHLDMVEIDPVLIGLLVVLIGLFFFVYLFLRRIATGFREGYEASQED